MRRQVWLGLALAVVVTGWSQAGQAQTYSAKYVGTGYEYARQQLSPGGFVGIGSDVTVSFTGTGWLPYTYSIATGTVTRLQLAG